ncbi:MAG: hypothetical protein AAF329_05730 [Cyanobacteria bacterium P01_A01_bin.17]
MIKIREIERTDLPNLPDNAVELLAIGKYSLFGVSVESNQLIKYALRTGVSDIFFLKADGEAIAEKVDEFEIQEKVNIKNCQPLFAVANFSVS